MSDQEQFNNAREVNSAFKAAVAQVQLNVFDGEWEIAENYGQTPRGCGGTSQTDSYEFVMTRLTPEGWKLDRSPAELGNEVAAWFDENGWTDVKLRTYSDGIADVVVEAEKPDEHAGLVVVDINPGELFDTVTIRATSTCEAGDWRVIVEEQRGSGNQDDFDPDRAGLPATEHPTDPPAFGLTDEGEPRYGDESDG